MLALFPPFRLERNHHCAAAVVSGLPVLGKLLDFYTPEYQHALPQLFDEMGEQFMIDMGPLGLQLCTRTPSDIEHVLTSDKDFIVNWPGTPPNRPCAPAPPPAFLSCSHTCWNADCRVAEHAGISRTLSWSLTNRYPCMWLTRLQCVICAHRLDQYNVAPGIKH